MILKDPHLLLNLYKIMKNGDKIKFDNESKTLMSIRDSSNAVFVVFLWSLNPMVQKIAAEHVLILTLDIGFFL